MQTRARSQAFTVENMGRKASLAAGVNGRIVSSGWGCLAAMCSKEPTIKHSKTAVLYAKSAI